MSAPDAAAWRPEFPGEARLHELRRTPGVVVLDTFDQQHAGLRELRDPPPDLPDEPAVWVYYPWRRTVARLLGPVAFHTLRTDRNRNKITRAQQRTLRELTIGIAGLSVGHAIAHTLALEGLCGRIRLADFDHVELSNLNRIPAGVLDLGVNKSVVAARRIAEIDPYLDVEILTDGIDLTGADRFVAGLDVVIEECDAFDLKLALRAAARRHRVPLIMETSDRGMLDVERYDAEPGRPLFHGLLGDLTAQDLAGLSTHDKVPHVLRVLEPREMSAAMAASLAEVDETLNTWPQLGGDIMLGAASVAAAVRAVGLGRELRSGRVRIDLDQQLTRTADPVPPPARLPATPHDARPEPPPSDAVGAVLHAARLAPSGGNVQPWHLRADDDGLEIRLDPTRTTTLDLAFRGSHVAIGAALHNARVAAARHGILGTTEIPADGGPGGDRPVARLTFETAGPAGVADSYEAMLHRVSNRHVGRPRPVPRETLAVLHDAAGGKGARADIVTDRHRIAALAELLGESDRIRYLTDHLHREMMAELREPGRTPVTHGLDLRTLELDDGDLAKLEIARRPDVMHRLAHLNAGRALGEPTRDRVTAASALAVVTVDGSDPADYVHGGQAAERLWIEAQRHGLAVQAISPVFLYAVADDDYRELSPHHATALAALHREFRELTNTAGRATALVLRFTDAPAATVRSLRRPARSRGEVP